MDAMAETVRSQLPITGAYRKHPRRSVAIGVGFLFPDKRKTTIFRKEHLVLEEQAGQQAKDKRRLRIHGWT
jgi:hypothetical protein